MDFVKRDSTSLVVIDMQERLMGAMPEESRGAITDKSSILINSANILNIPVVVTEQYPKGLGPTIHEVKEAVGENFSPIEKVVFSCARSPEFKSALSDLGRKDVIICGIETHVCVLQTAIDLVNDGYNVYVAADAVTSRKELDRDKALDLIEKAGATVGTTETFLFQLLERAGTDEFKAISKLVK